MAKKTAPSRSKKSSAATRRPSKRVAKKRASRAPTRRTKPAARAPRKIKPWPAAEVHEAFDRFRKASPEPKSELEHLSPYTLLVAVALSAQATDAGVNKATRNLFPIADTPQKMVELGEDRLRELIKTIGLYRNKAKNVIVLSERLLKDFGGEVPNDREALESLPGVGRKTANVVMNVAFGQPTMGVDTHVFRVSNRTGLAPGKNPLEVEMALMRRVPPAYAVDAHHWLILHGRYVCVARTPRCWECAVDRYCDFRPKTPAPGAVR